MKINLILTLVFLLFIIMSCSENEMTESTILQPEQGLEENGIFEMENENVVYSKVLGDWEYAVWVNQHTPISTFINAVYRQPSNLGGIRMLNSQRYPGSTYYNHLFVRRDASGQHYYMSYVYNYPGSSYISSWLENNISAPLAFYQKSSGTAYFKAEYQVPPGGSGGDWRYFHIKDDWSTEVQTEINLHSPSDFSGIRMMVSQRYPSGTYDVHLWTRRDNHPTANYLVHLDDIDGGAFSTGWVDYFLTGLNAGIRAPLAFYESSSTGSHVWWVEKTQQQQQDEEED